MSGFDVNAVFGEEGREFNIEYSKRSISESPIRVDAIRGWADARRLAQEDYKSLPDDLEIEVDYCGTVLGTHDLVDLQLAHIEGFRTEHPLVTSMLDSGASRMTYTSEDRLTQKRVLQEAVPAGWDGMTTGAASPDMVDLLQHAMPDCPIQYMRLGELPFVNGYVHLEAPLWLPEKSKSGNTWLRPVRGMNWVALSGSEHPNPVVSLQDVDRPTVTDPAAIYLALYSDAREPSSVLVSDDADDDKIASSRAMEFDSILMKNNLDAYYKRLGCVTNTWNVVTFIDLHQPEVERRHDPEFMWIIRAFHTLWALMGQRVAHTEPVPLQRPLRRHAERNGIVPRVVTIHLRRDDKQSSEPGSGDVDYSHRWVVRGHWRHYRDDNGNVTKRTWIRPHVKGPEDKPLVVKQRVFRLDR
jgi:hypothetical protein